MKRIGDSQLWMDTLVLVALVLWAPSVSAQSSADSTRTEGGLSAMQRAIAAADSLSPASAESLATEPDGGFDWFTSFSPTLKSNWNADVTRAILSADLSSNTIWLDGMSMSSTLGRSNTTYRQQDRDQVKTDFNTSVVKKYGGNVEVKASIVTRRNEDTNRLANGDTIVLEQNAEQAQFDLTGHTSVVEGIQQRWAVTGRFDNSRQLNRGSPNNRKLAKGGISSRWIKEDPNFKVVGKFGLLGESGTRTLLSFDADASARSDTLGATLDLTPHPRWKLSAVAERAHFVEDRLELARNSSGLIDTSGVDLVDQVGGERESKTSERLSLDLDGRLWPAVAVKAKASHNFTETQFVFSPQGILQNGRNQLEGETTLRYAAAGSLRTQLSFDDSYNDRRTRDSEVFRGRQSRQVTELRFDWDQHLFAASDLDVIYRQTLTQTINEEITNKNDRDLLVSRVDAEIKSTAIAKVDLSAGATFSTTDDINIDAERVGNNKRDTLLEVRGGYTYNPTGSLQILQNYRLQIVFVDVFEDDSRDQFNKQAQLRNQISYLFSSGPRFELEYLVDFRRNGTRDVTDVDRETYLRTLRRFDHQFTARMKIPIRALDFEAWTKRGLLREQRGSIDNEEDRGEVHMSIGGNRSFFEKKATLSLDLERILQFGPRVREEAEDYWKANTSISVVF